MNIFTILKNKFVNLKSKFIFSEHFTLSAFVFVVFILCTLIGGAVMYVLYTKTVEVIKKEVQIASEREASRQKVFRKQFELDLVKEDLNTYGSVSSKLQTIIVNKIGEVSEKYNLPIGLLHGIFRVESEYRFYITHPTVKVSVHNRTIETNALGLGGILWCYWGDSLRSHGIAESETDLYLPEVNIEAAAYILRYLVDDELKEGNSYILPRVITRYYGVYSSLYLTKMQSITSDLWMKRIEKELKLHNNYLK